MLATLIRVLDDFDAAEEALQDAFRAALEQWPRDGVPADPARLGLVSAGPFQSHRRHAAAQSASTPLEEAGRTPLTSRWSTLPRQGG